MYNSEYTFSQFQFHIILQDFVPCKRGPQLRKMQLQGEMRVSDFLHIAYALIKKPAISTFQFNTGYFVKEIENNFFPCSHALQKHSWKFGRTQISISLSPKLFPLQFIFLPNLHSYLYKASLGEITNHSLREI